MIKCVYKKKKRISTRRHLQKKQQLGLTMLPYGYFVRNLLEFNKKSIINFSGKKKVRKIFLKKRKQKKKFLYK